MVGDFEWCSQFCNPPFSKLKIKIKII